MENRTAVLNVPEATGLKSMVRVMEILRRYGMPVAGITPEEIWDGKLDGLDLLIVPGGLSTGQAKALRDEGCRRIENFVGSGGGYLGICAGAYLAARGYNPDTSRIQLVNAEIPDIAHSYRGVADLWVSITQGAHPIVQGFSGKLRVHYENGPILVPGTSESLPAFQMLAKYRSDLHQTNAPAGLMPGSAALTASSYGSGRCVLFSFHPELTPGLENMLAQGARWAAGDGKSGAGILCAQAADRFGSGYPGGPNERERNEE